MFKSFRATLVLIILMSASLPVILLSGILVNKIHRNTREAALKELNLKVINISNALRYKIDRISSGLRSLGGNRDIALATRKSPLGVTHFLGERSSDYLHVFLSDHPLVAAVHVIDLNLETVLSAPGPLDAPWPAPVLGQMKKLLDQGPGGAEPALIAVEFRVDAFISKSLRTASGRFGGRSEYGLVFIAPVMYDVTSEIKGALAALIPFENLARGALGEIKDPTILDFYKGSARIYQPPPFPEREDGDVESEGPYISSGASLIIWDSEDGGKIEYVIEISEPSSIWFADVNRTMKRLMLSIAGAMVLLILFAYMASSWLTRPFKGLIRTVNDYVAGDYAGASKTLPKNEVRFTEFRKIINLLENMGNEITERIRGLRKAEEKYSGLLNRLNEAVYRISLPDGRYEYISPAAEAVFGYPESAFIDNPCLLREIIHSDFSDYLETEWARLRQGDPSKHYEYKIVDREGGERWIHQSNTAVFDENGKIIALEACCTDVTQRKKAVEEQRRLRNILGNIINSMPSALVGVDMSGRVTQWNREAEKITGVDGKEAHGRKLDDVYPHIAGLMDSVREAIGNRKVKVERIVGKINGAAHYSDATVYPLTGNGDRGAVIRVDDVTERVRMEEMLIQSEKMMSVGGLAAGMAHEINNPLAGMLQNTQVILNRLRGDLPGNIRAAEQCGVSLKRMRAYMNRRGIFRMMEIIQDSGRRASRIVKNMLSFSRGSQTMTSTHDLSRLLDMSVELAENDYDLKKSYDFRHIEIRREYAPDAPMVVCEQSKIQQVFFNILKNGAQAMEEFRGTDRPDPGDSRRTRPPERENPLFILRVMRDGDHARVEIEDNGPGMEPSVRGRIFDPFFTTKDVGLGTGLGLSVSYFIIVENHGGEMFAESTPGKGTTFVIRLPLETAGSLHPYPIAS